MRNNKQGISLIVLVITIIVMIILASTIIVTLSNNGIIKLSSEAVFKSNVKNYQSDLSMYIGNEIIKKPKIDIKTINSTSDTIGKMIASIAQEDKTSFGVIGR